MFNKLLTAKTVFEPLIASIQLAIGKSEQKTALVAQVNAEAFGKNVSIKIVHFPGFDSNKCLLGLNFLIQAGVKIDLESGLATTSGQNKSYPLFETELKIQTNIENKKAKSVDSDELNKVQIIDENGNNEIFGSDELPPDIADYKLETQPAKEKNKQKYQTK